MPTQNYGHSLLTGQSFSFDTQEVPTWNSSMGRLEGISLIFREARRKRGVVLGSVWNRFRLPQSFVCSERLDLETEKLEKLIHSWLWLSGLGVVLYLAFWCLTGC